MADELEGARGGGVHFRARSGTGFRQPAGLGMRRFARREGGVHLGEKFGGETEGQQRRLTGGGVVKESTGLLQKGPGRAGEPAVEQVEVGVAGGGGRGVGQPDQADEAGPEGGGMVVPHGAGSVALLPVGELLSETAADGIEEQLELGREGGDRWRGAVNVPATELHDSAGGVQLEASGALHGGALSAASGERCGVLEEGVSWGA